MVEEGLGICTRLRRPNRKLQPDEIDGLVQRYEAGVSMSELAGEFGMHFQTVRAHLRRRGIDLRSDHQAMLPSQVAEAVTLYGLGQSSYDLAKRYSVDRTTVTKHLKRAGIAMRSHSG